MKKKISYLSFAGILLLSLTFVGCKKQIAESTPPDAAPSEKMLQTPFGLRSASQVHLVENGYHLKFEDNHLLKVQTTSGKVVEDFGLQAPVPPANNIVPSETTTFGNPTNGNEIVSGQTSGWITYAQSNTAMTLTDFYAKWHLPSYPATNNGQVLYIFSGVKDGLDPNSHMLQSVMQYGDNGLFGGNYWTINNWYTSCSTCDVYYASPIAIGSGFPPPHDGTSYEQFFTGGVEQTAQSDSNYSYRAGFSGYTSTYLYISNVPQLTYPVVGMEAYGMTQYSDYPADLVCRMEELNVYNGYTSVTPTWTAYDVVTDYGQHTTIGTNEIDLYFHSDLPAPAINNRIGVAVSYYNGTRTGIITATPGSTVYVTVSSNMGIPPTITDPIGYTVFGISPVLLSGGGDMMTVNRTTETQSFIMPATGFVNWSAQYWAVDDNDAGYGAISVNY